MVVGNYDGCSRHNVSHYSPSHIQNQTLFVRMVWLFNDTWSRTFGVMYDHTFSKLANHQIRHQVTYKVGGRSSDCIWSFILPYGFCMGMYGLIDSLNLRGQFN